jgi:tRNA A-37 threonylcarbamoyl transferase component Bud32
MSLHGSFKVCSIISPGVIRKKIRDMRHKDKLVLEVEAMRKLKSLGYPVPEIYAVCDTYIDEEYISGPTLRETPILSAQQYTSLQSLKEKMLKDVIYISDINRSNIIWSEERNSWYIVDCGKIYSDNEVFVNHKLKEWNKHVKVR